MDLSNLKSASLEGKLNGFGAISFLRADHWHPDSDCVHIYYAVNGEPAELPLRMDRDKEFLLDRTGIPDADSAIMNRRHEIRNVVKTVLGLN